MQICMQTELVLTPHGLVVGLAPISDGGAGRHDCVGFVGTSLFRMLTNCLRFTTNSKILAFFSQGCGLQMSVHLVTVKNSEHQPDTVVQARNPSTQRLKREDLKFKACQGYEAKPSL